MTEENLDKVKFDITERFTPEKGAPEKEEDKKVEKVVIGEVTRRKKPLVRRFRETFIQGEARSVWAYLAQDVLIPAAKDMVMDAVSQGIERTLFGESTGRSRRGRPGSSQSYVSYDRYSRGPQRSRPGEHRQMSHRARTNHDFDEVVLSTRQEADEVLDRLYDLIQRYDVATVSDLYELVGISGNFTDQKWGWTELRGSGVARVRAGYLLELPRPEPID